MSGDTREMVIQLIVGALCAALFYVLPMRARRRPHARVLQVVVALAIVALVVIGLVEARVIAAVVAGAGIGILLAGAAIVTRAAQSRAASALTTARRALGLLGIVGVAVLPLLVLGKTTASESVMRLTRAAASNSDGSWVVAWQRSWAFLLDPEHLHLRLSVIGSWMLLVALGFVAVAIALSRVTRWRLAAEARDHRGRRIGCAPCTRTGTRLRRRALGRPAGAGTGRRHRIYGRIPAMSSRSSESGIPVLSPPTRRRPAPLAPNPAPSSGRRGATRGRRST